MAVSEISNAANTNIQRPTPKSGRTTAPATTTTPATTATPAAQVEISHQALRISAATQNAGTPPTATATATSTAPAPKVNSVKVANKEANEPLLLLTKQAKHGDPVAKILLKQINARQAAKAAEATTPEKAAAASEDTETEETSEKPAAHESAEPSGSAESAGTGGVSEAGKGELVDQHA
jgi:hypothetical protein